MNIKGIITMNKYTRYDIDSIHIPNTLQYKYQLLLHQSLWGTPTSSYYEYCKEFFRENLPKNLYEYYHQRRVGVTDYDVERLIISLIKMCGLSENKLLVFDSFLDGKEGGFNQYSKVIKAHNNLFSIVVGTNYLGDDSEILFFRNSDKKQFLKMDSHSSRGQKNDLFDKFGWLVDDCYMMTEDLERNTYSIGCTGVPVRFGFYVKDREGYIRFYPFKHRNFYEEDEKP